MKATFLSLTNFRNFKKFSLPLPNKVILSGRNGVGKTTIIEALFVVLNGRSFKESRLSNTINTEAELSYVKTHVENNLGIKNEIFISISRENKKRIRLDGDKVSRKILINNFKNVIITHRNIVIDELTPATRRTLLDKISFYTQRGHLKILMDANKVRRNINSLLKLERVDKRLYSSLKRTFYRLSDSIREMRRNTISRLNFKLDKIHKEGKFPEIHLSYKEKDDNGKGIYGYHNDDFVITVGGKDLSLFSLGEKSLYGLLVRMAELMIYKEYGIFPIVMMDDVLSFMDHGNRELFLSILSEIEFQIIVSFYEDFVYDGFETIKIGGINDSSFEGHFCC